MKLVTNVKGKKALLVEAGGGTCAIAEGVTKEDLMRLDAKLDKGIDAYAKRHGLTRNQLDAMSNDELWNRAAVFAPAPA